MSAAEIQSFMNEVEADLLRLFGELMQEHAPEEPTHLYHYTSIVGLVGIAGTRTLFLSDMLASADQSEIRHGVGVLKEVLEEHDGDPMAGSFLQSFRDDVLWWGIGKHIFVHAICFCETNDVLTQWRGYSPNSGVAIGVKFAELMRRAHAGEFLLGNIPYARDAQRALVQRIFDCGREHLDRLRRLVASAQEVEGSAALDDFLRLVSRHLLSVVLLFKHDAFASEEEWRVFTIVDKTPDTLKFRARGDAIMPYVELPFEPTLISGIQCSPGAWSRSTLHAVERLATSLGDVNVTQSSLPL